MIAVRWLGTVAYRDALGRQVVRREGVIAGIADPVLWMLEHPRVVTTGRRGGDVDDAERRRRGIDRVATRRGGLATYHGPRQLVGYLIVDLRALEATLRGAGDAVFRVKGFTRVESGTAYVDYSAAGFRAESREAPPTGLECIVSAARLEEVRAVLARLPHTSID